MKKNYFTPNWILITCLFVTLCLRGQSDNCSTATLLTPGASCAPTSGTTTTATQSIAAITCNGWTGNADDDVWYRFVATSASHTVTVAGSGAFDAVIDVRQGSCNGTTLGCADSTFGGGTEIVNLTGLAVGATYYIRVYSYGGAGSQGSFTICVTTPPSAGGNDNCAGAISLSSSGSCNYTPGTTVGATQSLAGCTGNADDDVWYSFVATSANHNVTVAGTGSFDAVIDVRQGGCNGTSISCIDNTYSGGTEVANLSGLSIGSTYYIRVYSGGGSGSQGNLNICVTSITTTGNDNCAGATPLTVNTGSLCSASTSGTTVSATQSMAGCLGSADDDVWFSFVATGTSHQITVTPNTLYDAVFQVFSGSCGSLASLMCVDNSVGYSVETGLISGLVAGNTYYVRVYSYYSGMDQGTFTICVTTPSAPSNNNCSGATALGVSSNTSCTTSVNGTTQSATQSQAGCFGTADDDVWYSFVATGSSHTVTVTPGTLYDAVFQVFSGSCGALISLACIDNSTGYGNESASITGLTAGNTYFIRVYSYFSGAADQGTFSICVTSACVNGPGTGTTALSCPSVVSGGLGLNGADPQPIDCTSGSCVDLEATYLQLGQTTNYTVEAIPYAPPYQFGCLANPVSVNIDDVWSPVINLPFNFCFYGNSYNQCLISSNGVITFDLANNVPGGASNWSFSQNLPSASLFRNSIFGVYHDIDPSMGGTVGWELITLNTGCRALVASWKDIPMFSMACNAQLYSGMIVLYENTNVIEVYIQEKNVCASWNEGNAIVGVQNAAGTAAVVPPGRNGLDANWTVTNEAWRFVPSGSSITSLQWFEGSGTSGPMIGTTDVINVCPSATTTYTAQVTYTLCNGTTLVETEETTVTVNLSKMWNGSVSTDWNTAANWTPTGVPTSMDCVVIPNVANMANINGTSYDAFCYSLNVLNGGVLQADPGNNLTVTNAVNVQPGGEFILKNSASLLQVNNVANSGIMNMERITPPVYRFDYTYWNSPVTQASNFTLGMLSPNTQYDKYYSWTPSVSGGMGIWAQESAATVMDPTKGYIVRAPNSYSFTPDVTMPYTANFIGTPNNGTIYCPVSFGTMGPGTDYDKWNLIGNPYPSAVYANAFINHPSNIPVLDGTLYFWTHNSPISVSFADPFYGDYVLNYSDADYAALNSTGGTAATSGGAPPGAYIGAGQSFFVRSLAVAGQAVFNNAMRVPDNNAQFFRPASSHATPEAGEPEGQRLWLNLRNDSGAFSQILVGYVQGATLDWDRGFDGLLFSESSVRFYSTIPGKELVIQGRPLPFNVDDEVPLGIYSSASGSFSIRIDHFDPAFEEFNIYLEDKWLNLIHDLKVSPYNFATQAGAINDRFVLRYTDNALSISQSDQAGAILFVHEGQLYGQSSMPMKTIQVFDVAGKLVRSYQPISNLFTEEFNVASGVYPARVQFSDGSSAIFKLMH